MGALFRRLHGVRHYHWCFLLPQQQTAGATQFRLGSKRAKKDERSRAEPPSEPLLIDIRRAITSTTCSKGRSGKLPVGWAALGPDEKKVL